MLLTYADKGITITIMLNVVTFSGENKMSFFALLLLAAPTVMASGMIMVDFIDAYLS